MKLEQTLQQLGLEKKEAKVYLAALELGPTNIQNLTEKSEIKRSTVYEMIKNLKNNGLLAETTKGKRKLIIAVDPEKLKQSIKEKEKKLEQILPELKSIQNTSGSAKPRITFYEGKNGLREIYMIALKAKDKKADWISPMRTAIEMVGKDFMNEYIEIKRKKNFWVRSIHVTGQQDPDYKYADPRTYEETLRKVRFTPQELDIPNVIGIWEDNVTIMSSRKEGMGFIIESKEYARSMKTLYNILWDTSKTYGDMDFQGLWQNNKT